MSSCSLPKVLLDLVPRVTLHNAITRNLAMAHNRREREALTIFLSFIFGYLGSNDDY